MIAKPHRPLPELHASARQTAAQFRLPLRTRAWRGIQGNWQGAGTGSSIDFQDHRPYVPGDDPRYINWQAYARSGAYTMKLYREEVSPAVDLVLDRSGSMFVDEKKAGRTAELLYWAVESALQAGASLHCFALAADGPEPLSTESILSHEWVNEDPPADLELLRNVRWRHGSLRVLISDLLWPGDPHPLFNMLCDRQGHGIIYAVRSQAEAEPEWSGNLEMRDCESGAIRLQRVDPGVAGLYREAYRAHFDLWEQQAIRYHVPLARVSAEGPFAEVMEGHAREAGAVEWVR